MLNIWLALACFAVSVMLLRYARRCKHNPQVCVNRFITQFGVPQSIFAAVFIGDAERARKAFLEDKDLRRKYVIEQYVKSIAVFIAGILLLFVKL